MQEVLGRGKPILRRRHVAGHGDAGELDQSADLDADITVSATPLQRRFGSIVCAFGVARARIRQIENNPLKKLESLPEAQGLKDCV